MGGEWVGLHSPLGPGTQDQKTSKTTFPSFARFHTDDHHHHGFSATILVCDIRPAVLCLWPEVASEATRHLWGASSLEEAEAGLPGTGCMSGVATTMAATGTQCGSSGLWSSLG